MALRTLELIIPLYNEMEVLPELFKQAIDACQNTETKWRIIFIDDGSSDETGQWLEQRISALRKPAIGAAATGEGECLEHGQLSLISLSRNFGQQQAIIAGLDATIADCVIVMDGDLQDPPELIARMVELWSEGAQVVIPQRTSRRETPVRAVGFWLFHRLFRYLSDSDVPPRTGNFCLLDRMAVEAIGRLNERHRYLPGLRALVGFRQVMLPFDRHQRGAGQPKQSMSRLVSYAFDAILGFSAKPLKLIAWTGVALVGLGGVCSLLTVAGMLIYGAEENTFSMRLIASLAIGLSGTNLTALGVVGAYIRRVYDEVRDRPAYLIASVAATDLTTEESGTVRRGVLPIPTVVDRHAA